MNGGPTGGINFIREESKAEDSRILTPRFKRYAPWPVVLWCRLVRHRNQETWDFSNRCVRCGDVLPLRDNGELTDLEPKP